jgi:glyoxylase-like metal-dependent hydrolase (beta-lactamase superfamily II)
MPGTSTSIPEMKAPETGVTVRMYRTGFGDCFLLAFRGNDGAPVYMLIDCGVHSQYKGGGERIREIAEHIRASTDGRLDVVAITHEHADHISGFYTARDVFEDMTIRQAWFGWTEKPDDPEVNALKRERAHMINALRATEKSLAANNNPAADNIGGLLSFFDVFGATGADAMNVIRGKVPYPQYLKPKCRPLSLPRVDGVRVFVLGPPENRKSLMASNPSAKPGEVYTEPALAAAILAAGGYDSLEIEEFQPFASNYRILFNMAREQKKQFMFFHKHYGFGEGDPAAWRRISLDWQYAAESLALKLDSATNNTSLVLAIELQNSGRVLLFPGDAQVGNWESWHEGGWSEENGLSKGEVIRAKDLLARTVLYKVGHHGSHNATLREKGLEMMTSEELTAMIPVDKAWASARKPNPWKMPFQPLYADLQRRTKGRILRTDYDPSAQPATPAAWDALQWGPLLKDLYLELSIGDG